MDMYGFYTGKIFDAYEYLGCHWSEKETIFRVFAPSAEKITVMGDFNGWMEIPMQKVYDGNFWECQVEGVYPGMRYKYRIYRKDGRCVDHCDPYGYGMEFRPESASITRDLKAYKFKDRQWMRTRTDGKDKPLNIYELHVGSWRTRKDREYKWYTYSELASEIISYVKQNGYNYIELLPISEHPSDNSWGYQNTGFYSPSSRYGTVDDLKFFVDQCHQNNIGVILDFVPVHFAVDEYALTDFDGTALYEYPYTDIGTSEWGSKNFNHSRGEVRSFLQSSANYWLKEYHFDGIRVDALSNLIYWQGNSNRGENLNAIEFIKYMNQGLKERYPSIILAAEDSTSYPKVTRPVSEGGLGFDYKWDMGWMNDTLSYMQLSPFDRRANYHKLTFSMMYYYNENFILPLSHDEVVHGKATILQKMNDGYEKKFPQARAFYMYMYAHPGKKLNFMGNELGQLREWDEKREQDWDILQYPIHDAFHRFMKDLNRIYLKCPAFSSLDFERQGFEWIDCHQEEKCIYVFMRTDGEKKIIAIFNFSEKEQQYMLRMNEANSLQLLLASDNEIYGGTVSYKKKKSYKKTEEGFLVSLSEFSAKYFVVK